MAILVPYRCPSCGRHHAVYVSKEVLARETGGDVEAGRAEDAQDVLDGDFDALDLVADARGQGRPFAERCPCGYRLPSMEALVRKLIAAGRDPYTGERVPRA